MNEERLEREKNKRIKLNGSTSTSQSTSLSQTYPTSSATNGNSTNKKVPNGRDAEKQEGNQKEVAKLNPKIPKLSTSCKRIQKELAELTLDPPPNVRFVLLKKNCNLLFFNFDLSI